MFDENESAKNIYLIKSGEFEIRKTVKYGITYDNKIKILQRVAIPYFSDPPEYKYQPLIVSKHAKTVKKHLSKEFSIAIVGKLQICGGLEELSTKQEKHVTKVVCLSGEGELY